MQITTLQSMILYRNLMLFDNAVLMKVNLKEKVLVLISIFTKS